MADGGWRMPDDEARMAESIICNLVGPCSAIPLPSAIGHLPSLIGMNGVFKARVTSESHEIPT